MEAKSDDKNISENEGVNYHELNYSARRRVSLPNIQQVDVRKYSNIELYNQYKLESALSPRPFQVVGNYDIIKTIGKGQFGKVKLARHVITNDLVAVKIINKQKLDDDGKKTFEMEMSVMKKLSHPNIVRLYEVIETNKFFFLIMEYASAGEVLDFIVKQKNLYEEKARVLFRQLISAVSCCHKNSVVHRDLKCENLLLDSNLTIKVIDFGLSNTWSTTSFLKTACGSPLYAAPEVIEHKEYVGPEVDIWSMGVILYVFLVGLPPFEGEDMLTLYTKILNCDYKIPPEITLSPECLDLLGKILVYDPKIRATMEDLKKHPWVKSNDDWVPLEPCTTLPISNGDCIDRHLLMQIEGLGYSNEVVIDALLQHKFNAPYAIYYLLQEKQKHSRDYMVNVANNPTRARRLGSNPVSSLQRKRIEMNENGRKRAASDCPEFTIFPLSSFARAPSRNESPFRSVPIPASHLSHLCNSNPTTTNNNNNNLPSEHSEVKIDKGYTIGQPCPNKLLDLKSEDKRNTDDNIVFIRNMKDGFLRDHLIPEN